jgi:hypothetical protein
MKQLIKIFFFTLILSYSDAYSQLNEDASYLKQAEDFFNQGLYNEAKAALTGIMLTCFDNTALTAATRKASRYTIYSKSEVEGALILWARIHIEKGETEIAEKAIYRLIEFNPNFKPSSGIYRESFYTIFKSYSVSPRLFVGAGIGMNKPTFKVKQVYSIYDSLDYSAKYLSKAGYIYTGFIEWQPFKNIGINTNYGYSKMILNRSLQGLHQNRTYLNYEEVIYTNELGATLRKYFLDSKLKPYIGIGIMYSKMRQSLSNIEINYSTKDRYTSVTKERTITKNSIDMVDFRNKNRFATLYAIGLRYQFKNLLFFAESKFNIDFVDFNNASNPSNTQELGYLYYYIDNDIVLTRFDFSLSMAYIFGHTIKSKLR